MVHSEVLLKILFFAFIGIGVSLEILGDTLFKEWVIKNKNIFLLIGVFFYLVATFFWAMSLRYEFLSKAVCIYTLINMIAVVLVGVMFFKENLTLLNKLGIGLGALSIILIEI